MNNEQQVGMSAFLGAFLAGLLFMLFILFAAYVLLRPYLRQVERLLKDGENTYNKLLRYLSILPGIKFEKEKSPGEVILARPEEIGTSDSWQ